MFQIVNYSKCNQAYVDIIIDKKVNLIDLFGVKFLVKGGCEGGRGCAYSDHETDRKLLKILIYVVILGRIKKKRSKTLYALAG